MESSLPPHITFSLFHLSFKVIRMVYAFKLYNVLYCNDHFSFYLWLLWGGAPVLSQSGEHIPFYPAFHSPPSCLLPRSRSLLRPSENTPTPTPQQKKQYLSPLSPKARNPWNTWEAMMEQTGLPGSEQWSWLTQSGQAAAEHRYTAENHSLY